MLGRSGAGSARARRPGRPPRSTRPARPGREDPALDDPALRDPALDDPAPGDPARDDPARDGPARRDGSAGVPDSGDRGTGGPDEADGSSDGADGVLVDPERAYRVAREIVLRKLETRDRTRAELTDALRTRATPEPVIEAVLDRLGEVGLVDDQRFARTWVESRQRTRGLAGRALTAELRRKGVPDDAVASAVGAIDPAAEERAAFELARTRVTRSPGLPADVLTRRVVGQLARRGYDGGLAYRAVRAAIEASRSPDHGPDAPERDLDGAEQDRDGAEQDLHPPVGLRADRGAVD